MTLSVQSFQQALCSLATPLADLSAVVALSGGLDSTVLLHLCRALLRDGQLQSLRAIHVHHGLNPAADSWVTHIRQQCEQWCIPLTVCHVTLPSVTQNIEKHARDARYAAFEEKLEADETLLVAHHLDDQAETLLFRLMRGTGITGLQGMPTQRPLGQARLVRPLLTFARADIEQYADKAALAWIEDDSNDSPDFDRNHIRHKVLPLLQQRWPAVKNSLNRLAAICRDSESVLSDVAATHLRDCQSVQEVPLLGVQRLLSIDRLQTLSLPCQRLLVRHWLTVLGYPAPSEQILAAVLDELVMAGSDSRAEVRYGHFHICRYRHFLYAGRYWSPPCRFPAFPFSGQSVSLPGHGLLRCMTDSGVQPYRLVQPQPCLCSPRSQVRVVPFAVRNREGRKSLKKWLHQLRVPFWLRDHLPVLHREDQLVAVPGLLIAEQAQARTGESGWLLHWEHPANINQTR